LGRSAAVIWRGLVSFFGSSEREVVLGERVAQELFRYRRVLLIEFDSDELPSLTQRCDAG
jgi:hypothetical protein